MTVNLCSSGVSAMETHPEAHGWQEGLLSIWNSAAIAGGETGSSRGCESERQNGGGKYHDELLLSEVTL